VHLNTHIAIGTATVLLIMHFIPIHFSFLEVAGAIVASFFPDLDYALWIISRSRKHHNHRMFPTHSIAGPIFLLGCAVVAFILLGPASSLAVALCVAAVAMSTHLFMDSLDFGLNLFLNGRLVGKKLVYGKKTPEEFDADAHRLPVWELHYIQAYYSNNFIRAWEIAALIAMILALLFTMRDVGAGQWWVLIAYGAMLGYHFLVRRRGMAALAKASIGP
jgi:hypothetical protein